MNKYLLFIFTTIALLFAGQGQSYAQIERLTNQNVAIETALGNVDGRSIVNIRARNAEVGTSFEDVWDPGGILVYATAGEQWEIISSSVNDTSAGTGVRTVLITYLDDIYTQQTETLTMNGTTAVTFTATNSFRFVSGRGKTWGSTGENQGNITIRVSSAGSTRGQISFDSSVVGNENGLNSSQDGHFTVPAGKTALITGFAINVSKNHDVTIRSLVRFFGEDGFIMVGEQSNYQNSFPADFATSPIKLLEKTDLKIIARSNNTTVPVNAIINITLVDN